MDYSKELDKKDKKIKELEAELKHVKSFGDFDYSSEIELRTAKERITELEEKLVEFQKNYIAIMVDKEIKKYKDKKGIKNAKL